MRCFEAYSRTSNKNRDQRWEELVYIRQDRIVIWSPVSDGSVCKPFWSLWHLAIERLSDLAVFGQDEIHVRQDPDAGVNGRLGSRGGRISVLEELLQLPVTTG